MSALFLLKTDHKIAYLTPGAWFWWGADGAWHCSIKWFTGNAVDSRVRAALLTAYDENQQSRLEVVMSEMDSLHAWEIESQVKTVLSKLGLTNLSPKVGQLSGGLRRRVQLAQVLLGDADLLLLDEPTNHLDIDTIEWLTHFLKNSKRLSFSSPTTAISWIIFQHGFLSWMAVAWLNTKGNYQDYVRLKAEQDERDAALLHKKQQLYKQELSWMRRQPQARATSNRLVSIVSMI